VSEPHKRIIDRHADHRKAVFVAGVARNSTALICDALNSDGRYRYLHEPFSDMSGPPTGLVKRLVWQEYMAPDSRAHDIRRYARSILNGRVHTEQVDRWVPAGVYQKRLISESRLNLWLKWFRVNFEGMPIVLVTRHPCAVVASRLLLERETRLRAVLANENFVSRYLAPFAGTIAAAKSQVEKHALMWAIEHYVPLREFRNDDLHVIVYERFLAQPDALLESLALHAGEGGPAAAYLAKSRLQAHASVSDIWRMQLSRDDVRRIMQIIGTFGLDMYALDMQSKRTVDRAFAPAQSSIGGVRDGGTQSKGAAAEGAAPVAVQEDNMADVNRELRSNLLSFEGYVETLRQVLHCVSSAARWQMSDWDWLWPRHEPFVVRDGAWRKAHVEASGVDQTLSSKVEDVYRTFREMPPELGTWAADWDGEINTFLRYMIDRLDERLIAVRAKVEDATEHVRTSRRAAAVS